MDRIGLGRTGLEVSPICFGCWQMGPGYWGEVDEEARVAAVRRAVELGVNFFDTADAYGAGESEKLLGKALEPFARYEVVIATKVCFRWPGLRGEKGAKDLSHDYIVWECEQSLQRLGVDYIDLYQAHDFEIFTHPEETARAFEELKQAGKVRHFGLSNYNAEQMRTMRTFGEFETLQPEYNLLTREIEDTMLPYCIAENMGVLCYSPLAQGLLTGKYDGAETFDDRRSKNPLFEGETFKANVAKVDQLKPIAEELGVSVTQLSLRCVLDHPAVHCAIVGIKNAAQIEDAAGAMGWTLEREQYYAARKPFN
jgi:aryl-alcohol dehydrogenase-like predicted oxidoreductase